MRCANCGSWLLAAPFFLPIIEPIASPEFVPLTRPDGTLPIPTFPKKEIRECVICHDRQVKVHR